jgi:hypothetical protein
MNDHICIYFDYRSTIDPARFMMEKVLEKKTSN